MEFVILAQTSYLIRWVNCSESSSGRRKHFINILRGNHNDNIVHCGDKNSNYFHHLVKLIQSSNAVDDLRKEEKPEVNRIQIQFSSQSFKINSNPSWLTLRNHSVKRKQWKRSKSGKWNRFLHSSSHTNKEVERT